jgi:hypothetical protein
MRIALVACLVGLTLPASPQELLTVDFNGDVHRLDMQTGVVTYLNNSGWKYTNALARNSAGEFYSVAQDNLSMTSPANIIRIDPVTGLGTAVAPSSINAVRGLAFGPNDELYATILGSPFELHLLDVDTGASTLIAPFTFQFGAIQGLAYRGEHLYGWSCGGPGTVAGLITIDPNTGHAIDVNLSIGGNCPDVQGLTFDDSGNLFGSSATLHLIKAVPSPLHDVGVGFFTPIWTHGVDVRGVDFIPSPASSSARALRLHTGSD